MRPLALQPRADEPLTEGDDHCRCAAPSADSGVDDDSRNVVSSAWEGLSFTGERVSARATVVVLIFV